MKQKHKPKKMGRSYSYSPERPKNKKTPIADRAVWFGDRLGCAPGSSSLRRYLQAVKHAGSVPSGAEEQESALAEGTKLLGTVGFEKVLSNKGPIFIDPCGETLGYKKGRVPKNRPFTYIGAPMTISRLPGPSAFMFCFLDTSEHPQVDLDTMMLFRKSKHGYELVTTSIYLTNENIAIAKIYRPGEYQLVALPANSLLRLTVHALCWYYPWLRIEPRLVKATEKQGVPRLNERICQLIQCAPDFQVLFDKPNDFRELLGVEFPAGVGDISAGGNLCEECLDQIVDFQIDPKLTVIFPPPILLLCWWWWLYRCTRWYSVGPFQRDGFWGIGRITQVDVHPTDGNTLIAAAAGGGVWKTVTGGDYWYSLMMDEPSLTMGAVAIAPSNPTVYYAASGEDGGQWNPAWPGVGVYRSGGGGSTWKLLSSVNSTRFSAIVVDPTNENIVYVAGNSGLHKSVDGGAIWIQNPGANSLIDGQITDVVIAHDDPQRIYVGVRNDGVYRSLDGGATLMRLDGGTQLPSGGAIGWIKLAIGRAGVNGSDFLAVKAGANGSRIFTTTDGGDNWTEQAANVAAVSFDEWASIIAVDPSDEDTLYAGAAGTLKRSDDGGTTWVSIRDGVHADQQDFAFSTSSNRIYLTNDGGVYRSEDKGANWSFVSHNMRTTQLYDIDISQRNSNFLTGAAQDNGVYFRDGSKQWRHVDFGWDGTQIAIDPTDNDIIYYSGQNGITRSNITKSTDGGVTQINISGGGLSGGSPWVTIIKLDPTDPIVDPENNRKLFICGSNQLFVSTDGGSNFDIVEDGGGTPFTTPGTIQALEFAPGNPNILYSGTSSGALYRGINGGMQTSDWSRIDTAGSEADALFPNVPIAGIAVDASDEDHVWVVFTGSGVTPTARPDLVLNPLGISHIFKTEDGGTNWVDASGAIESLNLPDVPTSAVAIDNWNRNMIFVGTDVGVFKTTNGGITWNSYQTGLPRSPVVELKLNRAARKLVAGTMGRGIFERRI